jgi:hypothetical protein
LVAHVGLGPSKWLHVVATGTHSEGGGDCCKAIQGTSGCGDVYSTRGGGIGGEAARGDWARAGRGPSASNSTKVRAVLRIWFLLSNPHGGSNSSRPTPFEHV